MKATVTAKRDVCREELRDIAMDIFSKGKTPTRSSVLAQLRKNLAEHGSEGRFELNLDAEDRTEELRASSNFQIGILFAKEIGEGTLVEEEGKAESTNPENADQEEEADADDYRPQDPLQQGGESCTP